MNRLHVIAEVIIVQHIDIVRIAALRYADNDVAIVAGHLIYSRLILSNVLWVEVCGKEILNPERVLVVHNVGHMSCIRLLCVEVLIDNHARIKVTLLHLCAPRVCAQVVVTLKGIKVALADKVTNIVAYAVLRI